PEFGGMGMPKTLGVQVEEMLYGANSSFALYIALTAGSTLALDAHGSEELKRKFLPNMYAGTWAGTMCLTEPHAGTDLGIIRTRSEEHTSELQSRENLVCRILLEKKTSTQCEG